MGEYDLNGEKNLRFQKYPDMAKRETLSFLFPKMKLRGTLRVSAKQNLLLSAQCAVSDFRETMKYLFS